MIEMLVNLNAVQLQAVQIFKVVGPNSAGMFSQRFTFPCSTLLDRARVFWKKSIWNSILFSSLSN